ncbi:MAG: RagB/SusD family nutrient uptake outer membrane protein [Tannerella sp.]|jgi:hypothetical protein|nr:RagB/SusD family nutrient uptake outer membrane protein [Tannerella sp.]
MKKIHQIYLIAILFSGVTASCHDELNVEPHTFVSDDIYYKTESQIQSAVNGVYNKLQDLYNGGDGSLYALTEMRADNTAFQYYDLDRGIQQREEINDFLMTATNLYSRYTWDNLWNAIQQSNVVIDHIDNATYNNPDKKGQYEGEARFLRALLYFHLVRLYGEIPLRDKATSGPKDAFSDSKASVEELYSFIMADVDFAIGNLPAKYTGADVGRATQGAALTLQGEIYLTRHDYQNAVTSFNRVTAMGYELMPDYADIFHPNYKNNVESIFEIQYSASLNRASNYIYQWGPRRGRAELIGVGGSGDIAGSNSPTLDIINAYEPGDERKDASITYWVSDENRTYQESFGPDMDSAAFINKFYHAGTYAIDGRADENWPVYRYGYVKLLLAEALNEAGRGSEALPLLNDVRRRAGLAGVSETDQTALREIIFKEERIEVAFENHRWYQLLRTGRAIEIMTAHGNMEKARLQAAAARLQQVCHLSNDAYNIQPYKLLLPLPERECRLNGFDNNPGWY